MAYKKISQLGSAATPLAGTEVLPIVQGGVTVKVSAADITAGRAVSASSLTLGTALGVSSGGTGQTSYTNGQLLIGNTTGNTLTKATLTAGSGIAITNGAGSVTIAATGGVGTVTSVGGTGTVNGITLTGTVTSAGDLTLGGTLSGVDLATQTTGTLSVSRGGTGATTLTGVVKGNGTSAFTAGTVALGSEVSGTLPVANGGTGQTSYTDGQLLIGNSTGNTLTKATLTAGSGISITNGPGSVTITATGGGGGGGTVTSVDVSGGTTGLTTSGGPITSSGTITLAGTLGVANGGTGVTTSTGTGSVVLSNSPTLVTPTLGAASATSIANALGTVGAPSYTFAGDTNTGMWSPAADTIAFSEGGAESMRIDASGNVSIGTTAGYAGYGSGRGLTLSNQSSLIFQNASNTWNSTTAGGAVTYFSDNNLYLDAKDSASNMIFRVNGNTERMRINPSGNVGIGTTSPGQRLTVAGVIESTTGGVRFPDGTTQTTAASGGGSTLTAVASGSLSDGSTVVINADGTVSVVGNVPLNPMVVGTPVVFQSSTPGSTTACAYDANAQKVVIAYRNSGLKGTAIVGTVIGNSISFGTPTVFTLGNSTNFTMVYNENAQKVVIAYKNSTTSVASAVVGTVSGTNISFGSEVVFNNASTGDFVRIAYDANTQKVVIAYPNGGNSNFGTAIVGTVSGTSISFGAAVVFESASTGIPSAIYDSAAQRVVIAYRNLGNSNFGTAIVGTVSGTSISFGAAVVFESASTGIPSAIYDSAAQRVVIAYRNLGNSNFGTAIVGTVSGTSISFGAAVVFLSAASFSTAITYDGNAGGVIIAYQNGGNSNFGTARLGTVSGTSISFGSPVVFESGGTDVISVAYDANAKRIVTAYSDTSNSNFATSTVLETATPNLTSENFIGFSSAAYTNGQTATIQIVGSVDDAQSGLTPGQSYFVQGNGTLGLAPGAPSVFAGTAVAANRIIVKG